MDPLLTTEDVAEFFRVDVVTVRRMINKGELAAYRVGGEYRFARSDIEEYLERQRRPAREEAPGHLGKLTERARKLVPLGAPDAPNRLTTRAFERFTDRARTSLVRAQEEAHRLHHTYLGTEHLLLGLVNDGESVAAQALSRLGVDLSQVRSTVEAVIGQREGGDQGEISLTPRAKKVMELAVTEAKQLDHAFVGTEHLLLGLLHEGEGVAARVLRDLGIELSAARRAVQEILAKQDGR
jgi:excisionase family DNA binding protein